MKNPNSTDNTTFETEGLQESLTNTVRRGFGLVLTLTFILGLLGVFQLNSVNKSMNDIVEVNNKKTSLTFAMRDAIRVRSELINRIRLSTDHFERDSALQEFYAYAGKYRQAREGLLELEMDSKEREVFEKLSQRVQTAQPLTRKAAESLFENLPESQGKTGSTELSLLLDKASKEQQTLLNLLDTSVSLQQQYTKDAVNTARDKFRFTISVLISVASILLIIGGFIARKVTTYVNKVNIKITEKNQALINASTEAKRATRAKSSFLASMSHEIRTPLTAIIGYSEILLDPDQTSDDVEQAAKAINRSGNYLHQLINDVLDISKIEAGEVEIEILRISPTQVAKDVLDIVSDKANTKGLKLHCRFDFPLPESIETDPTRLKQILLNLLGNAVKFTNRGSITLSVTYLEPDQKIQFSVIDTGIGMLPDEQRKIFHAFSQANQSTTRIHGGSGLGLTISKQLARHLGGDIDCTSELDSGSTFTLTISSGVNTGRVIDNNTSFVETQLDVSAFQGKPQLVGQVLLAEDSIDNRQLIRMYLEKIGVKVTAVSNGKEAVDYSNADQFDLILMDLQMPEMDGTTAIRKIRESGNPSPIVVLSANAMQSDKENCKLAGADGYLSKPIDLRQFYQTLASYLKPALQNQEGQSCTLEYDKEYQTLAYRFLDQLETTLEDINRQVDNHDWDSLNSTVHQLKGSGGAFGYQKISDISAKIMHSVKDHDANSLSSQVRELNRVCSEVIKQRRVG